MRRTYRQTASPSAASCGTVTVVNEPGPNCTSAADCAEGEECVNGTCQSTGGGGGGGGGTPTPGGMSNTQKILLALLFIGLAAKFM